MKFKASISLIVAIALALVTAKVGMDYIKKHGTGGVTASRAVVVVRDLEPGSVIQASDVALKEMPINMISTKTLRDVKDAVGRTVVMSIAGNYPVTENVLAPAGSGGGIQALIPPGMRLVPVDVSDSGVASLITPGCRVDVIVTLHDGDQPLAKSVVQNVKVQLVQRQNTRSSSGRVNANNPTVDQGPVKTCSLLVTPEQAVKIELANSEGKTRLVLRSGSDTDEASASVNRNGLLGKAEPEPEVKPPPVEVIAHEPKKGWQIQVIKGGNETLQQFDESGHPQDKTKGEADQQKKKGEQQNRKGEEDTSGATPATAAGKLPKQTAGAERNESESGTAPDQAPRTDAGRGNLP